jgi:long-chain acyl-CoA synthetase
VSKMSERFWTSKYHSSVPQHIESNTYQQIIDVFDESVKNFKDKVAFSNMNVDMTYNELDRLSGDFASFLQNELGLKKGDRIAIQMPNVLQFPVALFGAFRAGLIVVNTNPLYTAKEMQHQFKDSGAQAIVILANFAHLLQTVIHETDIKSVVVTELGDLFPFPKSLIVNSVVKHVKKMVPAYSIPQAYNFKKALDIGSQKAFQKVRVSLEETAFLQYTGGTTGVSKGAVLTHKNIISNMMQISAWMKPQLKVGEEIALTPLPMYHIFSLTVNCLAFMKYGSKNILITNPKDIGAFIKLMRENDFTIMSGVNTLFNALMNHKDFGQVNFTKLKVCVAGAMALQRPVSTRWEQLTKTKIVEGYGLTESSPVVCCNPIDGTDKPGTIGLPIPDTDIRIVDDNNVEVAFGQAGELCVKGPQVMTGYWNRPDETSIVIDQQGWLHTGDIASMDEDGFVKIVDRKKDMILVSGFNVYPNEVEEAIASHPGVLEVAAVGKPDVHSGEVVKVVIVKKDPQLTAEDVIAHAKKSLTNYKVPKVVEFRDELPKTNVGKILRRALR